jgi:thiol-disulfide isomerase/thioredoxin
VGERAPDRLTPVLVGLLLAGAVVMGFQEVADTKLVPEGAPAPDFTVQSLVGEPVTLSALKGQVVVVDFWATWCGPCREELPMLLETARAFEARGVKLVMVSTDDVSEQREAVEAFARREPGLAPYAAFGTPALGEQYLVRALPTLYVLDRRGQVVAARAGTVARWQLERWLEHALER